MGISPKLAELNVETGKRELEDIPSVEALPRYGDDEVNAQIADGREAAE